MKITYKTETAMVLLKLIFRDMEGDENWFYVLININTIICNTCNHGQELRHHKNK